LPARLLAAQVAKLLNCGRWVRYSDKKGNEGFEFGDENAGAVALQLKLFEYPLG
jgi:hypothetical protein